MPTVDRFEYTFDRLAEVIDRFTEKVGLKKYTLYVQDYGAPVGYRLTVKHPERVQALGFKTATPTMKGSTTTSGSRSRLIGRRRPRCASSSLFDAELPS